MSNLKKVIVVTGGATGIGRSISETLAKNSNVILCYNKSEEQATEISSQHNNITKFRVDVTRESDILNLQKFIIMNYGYIDAIVNNAGGNIAFNTTENFNVEDWDLTYDLNCKSVFLMSKHLNKLIQEGGSIINISSISSFSGGAPGGMAYASSKAAVDCMTKSLAKELAHKNINVNSVSPGVVYTNQHKLFSTKSYYDSLIERIPLKRDGKGEDIANMVNFLISEKGNYITGQVISINGGMLMR